jgi:hypothetical protein
MLVHLAPSLREQVANQPISKIIQFQGKLFTAKFLKAALAGPILGIDFLRKFKITIAQGTS